MSHPVTELEAWSRAYIANLWKYRREILVIMRARLYVILRWLAAFVPVPSRLDFPAFPDPDGKNTEGLLLNFRGVSLGNRFVGTVKSQRIIRQKPLVKPASRIIH